MSKRGQYAAFPCPGSSAGMTLRVWLTGKSLNGLLANPQFGDARFDLVSSAIWYADETLRQLSAKSEFVDAPPAIDPVELEKNADACYQAWVDSTPEEFNITPRELFMIGFNACLALLTK